MHQIRIATHDHTNSNTLGVIIPLFPLLLGVFFFGLAHGGLFPIMSESLKDNGYTESAIGFVGSAFFLGTIIGAMSTYYFVRRIGYIKWFCVLAAVGGIATISLVLTPDMNHWIVLRLIAGISMGGHWAIAESWLNFKSSNATRGKSLATYECFRMIGVSLSAIVLMSSFSGNLVYVFAGILFVVALIPLCFISDSEPELPSKESSLSILALIKISPFGSLCCVVAGFVLSSIFSMLGSFGTDFGLNRETELPIFIALTLFTPVLMHIPIGFMSDYLGRKLTILIISVIAVTTSLTLIIANIQDFYMLTLLCCIVSGMSNPLYALGLSHVNDLIDCNQSTKASGTIILINGLGLAIGPAVTGFSVQHFGKDGLFISIGSVLLLVLLSSLIKTKRIALNTINVNKYEKY